MASILRVYYYDQKSDTVFEIGGGYSTKDDIIALSWICEVFVNQRPDLIVFFGVQEVTTDIFNKSVSWATYSGEETQGRHVKIVPLSGSKL